MPRYQDLSYRYNSAYRAGVTDRSWQSKKRTRTGKFSQTPVRRSFQSQVKDVLMRKAETKYYDIGVQDNQLYHNLGHGVGLVPPTGVESLPALYNPWLDILKGTDRFNRIGDRISPVGMSLKFFIANKGDRPNTMVRIIVAILPKVVGGIITDYAFNPFQAANQGIMNNHLLLPADKDKGVKFLYDKIHTIGYPGVTSEGSFGLREKTKCVNLWIKRKQSRDIIYDTTSNDIVNKPLAVYAIPYEQYSTLQTANIASITSLMRMYYKDV